MYESSEGFTFDVHEMLLESGFDIHLLEYLYGILKNVKFISSWFCSASICYFIQ